MTYVKHSQTGRRSGDTIPRTRELWRYLRRWLTWRIPTHRKEPIHG